MSDRIGLCLHLLGVGTYFGATLLLLLLGGLGARQRPEPADRQRFLAEQFSVYNPVAIAALGIAIVTGAVNLTDYKAALGGQYFAQMGSLLVWKLGLVFLLTMNATLISFGLGHRIVRHQQWNEQLDAEKLQSILARFVPAAIAALVLVAAVVWLSVGMTHASGAGR